MRAVKRSGTKLESRFGDILTTAGLADFERQAADLPGTPDFVFRDRGLALFVDSCFWHGCPEHVRMPSSNVDYWNAKIAKNRERDSRQTEDLHQSGWTVERFWEHELRDESHVRDRLRNIVATTPPRTNTPRQ